MNARCQMPRCRRPAAIVYLDRNVCDPCWNRYMAEDAPEVALRKRLGIPLDNPMSDGTMDSHDESGTMPTEEPMAKGKAKKAKAPKSNGAEKGSRARAAKIEVGQKFIARHKGEEYGATVIAKEGGGVQIRANGNKVYPSLTAAAMAIVAPPSGSKTRISGPKFWRPEDEQPKPKKVHAKKSPAPKAQPQSEAATA